jgi:Flp pilus assembly protein TadG
MKMIRSILRPFASNCRGSSVLELALISPLFVIVILGVTDGSLWILSAMRVDEGARAGAQYAVAHSSFDAAGISAAITSAAPSTSPYLSAVSSDPAPTQWCGCPSGAGQLTQVTCGVKCSSGLVAGTYVTVTATATYTSIVNWPGRTASPAMTSSLSVRIQ